MLQKGSFRLNNDKHKEFLIVSKPFLFGVVNKKYSKFNTYHDRTEHFVFSLGLHMEVNFDIPPHIKA